MDVKKLNFFQKQYLTFFKGKSMKAKAELYQEIIRFVLEEHYSPGFPELQKKFPGREKTLVTELRYLEKKGFLVKKKYGTEFIFNPVLRPFVAVKESQEEVYVLYAEGSQYERGIMLKDKIAEILDGRKKNHRDEWKETFQATSTADGEEAPPQETADGDDGGKLPPNFDDTEDSSGLVVV